MNSEVKAASAEDIYQVIKKVSRVTFELNQISQTEGFNLCEIAQIWSFIPIEDDDDITFLERAGDCILQVSALVDKNRPELPRNCRTAIKFQLMSKLLSLKAEQLV